MSASVTMAHSFPDFRKAYNLAPGWSFSTALMSDFPPNAGADHQKRGMQFVLGTAHAIVPLAERKRMSRAMLFGDRAGSSARMPARLRLFPGEFERSAVHNLQTMSAISPPSCRARLLRGAG
jgi:hypothetical protein